MARVKTYWDEIKDKETFYTGNGWEIHMKQTEVYTFNNKTCTYKQSKRLEFCWPFRTGDGVKREERVKAKKRGNVPALQTTYISKCLGKP